MADNNFGLASVILGILSIVFAGVNGLIFGIISLIFSLKQKKLAKNKWARAGKILAIIGIIASILIIIVGIWIYAANPEIINPFIQ